ncbi:MAG: bifunctional [glutamate--ammonia ligase]-adenylyl-L-tyrosine phosphorylase/[glutamate--ammonia-ligase] adenylyltransferase, partial [Deltaproteobacteria bacterium]|nr:bifunctional [glutamate--ammonia ligase]-adenylyl-L-tyrosine phosphorylase/[glutamate--ammonia-ligase] adenylyltransferase [Deltaproteobacteria bacterium]
MNEADRWLYRAREIDETRAAALHGELGTSPGAALGVLLGAAFPPLRPAHGWQFDALETLGARSLRGTLSRRALLAEPPGGDDAGQRGDAVGRSLRRAVWSERARIALREILPRSLGGAPIDAMARDLSRLASRALEVAFAEARAHVTRQLGEPRRASGEPSTLVV